jgi:hypothetical protein
MSGGSYNYAYARVEEFAANLNTHSAGIPDYVNLPLRKLFRTHLRKVADAMRAIEWNDSGDGDDDEQRFITDVLRGMDGEGFAKMLDSELAGVEQAVRLARALLKGET